MIFEKKTQEPYYPIQRVSLLSFESGTSTKVNSFHDLNHTTVVLSVELSWFRKDRLLSGHVEKIQLLLEKALSFFDHAGIQVVLELGVTSAALLRSVPTSSAKSTALVGLGALTGQASFIQRPIPFLNDPETRDSLLFFLTKIFSLLPHYLNPQGPVVAIYFNYGVFQRVENLFSLNHPAYYFQRKYEDCKAVNHIYGTCFSNLENLAGTRVWALLQKNRPWLAAYDYRCFQNLLLEPSDVLFKRLSEESGLKGMFLTSLFSPPVVTFDPSPTRFVLDDTLLGSSSGGILPNLAEGTISTFLLDYFQMSKQVENVSKTKNIPIRYLSDVSHDLQTEGPLPLLVGFVRTYISKKNFKVLSRYLERGGKIYFPMGLPKYDDKLNPVFWGSSFSERSQTLFDTGIKFFEVGLGTLFYDVDGASLNNLLSSSRNLLVNIEKILDLERGQGEVNKAQGELQSKQSLTPFLTQNGINCG